MTKEINWEVGQEVWDILYGRGEVVSVEEDNYTEYPIHVRFDGSGEEFFTRDGKILMNAKRTLFFSEPIVTAEMQPTKKFKPVLKPGQLVYVTDNIGVEMHLVRILKETEDYVSVRYIQNGNVQQVDKKKHSVLLYRRRS